MKLGHMVLRAGAVAGIALAAGQWWLVQRTHEEAARIVARLMPHGELRYQRALPFPWSAGRVWGLSFQPEGLLRMNLQTAPGFRIEAHELRIDALRRDADGHLERLRGCLIGVRAPVLALRTPVPDSSDPLGVAPPTLSDLGYRTLEFDVAFDIRYLPEFELALLVLNLHGADLGRAALSVQLEGRPQTFSRAPDQIRVRKLVLDYADHGLLERYRQVWAARARMDLPTWEKALIQHLDHRAAREQWRWDADTADAVRHLVRDPSRLHAHIDPPGDVILRNIRLYDLADWPAMLGFRVSRTAELNGTEPVPLSLSLPDRLIDAVLSWQGGTAQ